MNRSLLLLTLQVVIVVMMVSGLTVLAHADTKTWTGAVNNLWSTPGNWNGGVPAAGDRIAFGATGINRTNTNDLAAGTVFYDITFLGNNYVISGNALGLTDGITSNSGTQHHQRQPAGGGLADDGRLLLLRSVEPRRRTSTSAQTP